MSEDTKTRLKLAQDAVVRGIRAAFPPWRELNPEGDVEHFWNDAMATLTGQVIGEMESADPLSMKIIKEREERKKREELEGGSVSLPAL